MKSNHGIEFTAWTEKIDKSSNSVLIGHHTDLFPKFSCSLLYKFKYCIIYTQTYVIEKQFM